MASATAADTPNCNQPASKPILLINLPGHPFEPIVTRDGCWIFVSMTRSPRNTGGITVLQRANGNVERVRSIDGSILGSPDGATGMVLTHDGQILIATVSSSHGSVAFLDTARLISGSGNPVLGFISDGRHADSVYVNVSPDDHFVFVSDEGQHSITVINLAEARRTGFLRSAIVGKIPTGNGPIALTFSPDGRYLYSTSLVALEDWGWPTLCTPEAAFPNRPDLRRSEGAILVVDVMKAETAPAKSVIARIPAGCSPVRLVLSPDGKFAYVTVRHENKLNEFNTANFLADPSHALVASVRVGSAPVGLAVIDNGSKVLVANSNRFGFGESESEALTVIEAASIPEGTGAILGSISAGKFPREMRVTADGNTLLLTNFGSASLELIDLNRLPIKKAAAHELR